MKLLDRPEACLVLQCRTRAIPAHYTAFCAAVDADPDLEALVAAARMAHAAPAGATVTELLGTP